MVGSQQLIKDEDDLEGLAGWLYHLESTVACKGSPSHRLAVFSEKSTARVVLKTGSRYVVFVFTDEEGMLRTANYCDEYSERFYSRELAQQILSCLESDRTGDDVTLKLGAISPPLP